MSHGDAPSGRATPEPVADPIVVGGVGGSGTRVVCELLRRSGVFVGGDLNPALDNLWFTLLFKRPRWLAEAEASGGARVGAALDLFVKAMVDEGPWSDDERQELAAAADAMAVEGHDHLGSGTGRWPFERVERMVDGRRARVGRGQRWGWKEPNSHVVLAHLARRFSGLRFVLVVRHGLDMAYSANHAQLHCWGSRYGVDPAGPEPLPVRLLRFWAAANEAAISCGTALMGDRFVVVRYEELCADPAGQAGRLLDRLALVRPDASSLAGVARANPTTGRHRREDLSAFTGRDFDAVRRLGFHVA